MHLSLCLRGRPSRVSFGVNDRDDDDSVHNAHKHEQEQVDDCETPCAPQGSSLPTPQVAVLDGVRRQTAM
jgi:hypothetical protein